MKGTDLIDGIKEELTQKQIETAREILSDALIRLRNTEKYLQKAEAHYHKLLDMSVAEIYEQNERAFK